MFKQDAFNKYGENNEDMLLYWNFIMVNQGRNSKRVRYNLIKITEQMGGLLAVASFILYGFFSVYNYRRN